MCLFKHLILFLCLSMVGLPAHAEPVANSETTNTGTTVTVQGIEELQAQIAKTQTAITEARHELQTDEQSLQRKIDRLETTKKIGQKRLNEAANKLQLGNQKIEELRVQRLHLQNTLDKQSAHLTELQTTLEELNLIESAERTQQQNQQQSAAEKDIALYQKAVDLGQQHLELLNQQTDLTIRQTLIAIEWQSQLQATHETHRIQEQQQTITDHQATLASHQENLEAAQNDLPNKIAALETTEASVDMLKEQFEKAALDKQKAAVEINNLELEHQSAKTRLDSKHIQELEDKLEQLSKTPPVEPEQMPLHQKRIAVLEKSIEQQKKSRELQQQQLDVLTQRLETAKKQLALATQWYDKLQAVYQKRQKEELEKQFQQKQQRYLAQASELRQQLDFIPDLEENAAQRQLLEIRIQEANELAQKAERQLKIRQFQTQFRHWREMALEQQEAKDITQTEVDKTKAALTELNTLLQHIQVSQTLLEEKRQALDKQLDMVKEQGDILSDQALTDNTKAQQRLKSLKSTWRKELEQLEQLLNKGNQLLTLIEQVYKESVHKALFRQRHMPSSAVEWWGLLTEMGTIPSILMQRLQQTGRGFWQAFQQTSNSGWIIISIVLLIWLSLVIGLSAWINRILNTSNLVNGRLLKLLGHKLLFSNLPKLPSVINRGGSPSLLSAGLRLWQKNTLSIAVTGVVLLIIWFTQPNQLTSFVTLIFLLTWLGAQWLINLSELLLSVSALPSRQHTKLYRQVRWTIIVLALFTVITALIHLESEGQIRLSLTASDLVDTLFMVLLSLSIPVFMRLRITILTLMRTNQSKGYWLLAINLVTLLLPGIILVVSVLGVISYVTLGWIVAYYLCLFLLVLSAGLIALGIINDLINWWKNWVSENSSYGSLWAEELIPLVHNLLGLALIGLCVIAFFWLTGWSSDVAIKESIKNVLFFPLISFGNDNQITMLGAVLSILLVWVVFWLGGWFRRVSYQWIFIKITDIGIRHSLSVFIQYVVVLVGLLITLKTIGIDPTALVVFAGAIGVGIGFGLQNIADNFISGILLLIERPLRVGDFVEIESPQGAEFKYSGTVTKIGIRSMTLETEDSKKVVVPNSGLISGPFVNWSNRSTEESEESSGNIVHTDLDIGISYDSDPHLAEKLLKEVLEETPEIVSDPAFEIYLLEFADFKMNFRIDYYIDTDSANSIQVKSKVLFGIWDRFKSAGIKIPSPPGMYLHSVS